MEKGVFKEEKGVFKEEKEDLCLARQINSAHTFLL